jgi:hypothetical protein
MFEEEFDRKELERIIKNVQKLIEEPKTRKMLEDLQQEFFDREVKRKDIIEWEHVFFNKHGEPTIEALKELFDKWLELLEYDVRKEKEYYNELDQLIIKNKKNVTVEILKLSALIVLHKQSGLSTMYLNTIKYGAYAIMYDCTTNYNPDAETKSMVEEIFGDKNSTTDAPKDLKDFLEGLRKQNNG